MNFDETKLKSKSYHTSNNKVQLFCKNSVVIKEEWFADINLTSAGTILTALIKCAKSRINNKGVEDL